jgi:diguanylate cyclase (GGDEF)-like protein
MFPRLTGSREVELLSGALRSLLRRVGDAERRTAQSEELRVAEGRRHDENVGQLRRLADTDPLTGLLNRRSFERSATQAMEHFRHNGRPFAVFVIDIDHFKRVNDTYGHVAGDEAIRHIADILAGSVTIPDRMARVGGEEFVALLHEMDADKVMALAERMRSKIAESDVSRDKIVIRLTVSIGVSMVQSGDRDIEDVVSRADASLYEAKAAGRNRIVFWTAEETALDDVRAA